MKIELVGESYRDWSITYSAQKTVNFFPVFSNQGREVSALYGTPGLEEVADSGAGPIRGSFKSRKNGRVFFVSSSILYEIDSSYALTSRGNLDQSAGNITICENTTQMAVCDGANVYIFTYATNNWAKVTDPDLPVSGTITSIDNFFVVNEVGTDKFYISDLADGSSWVATEFKSAESNPDQIKRVFNAMGQLWCFGEVSTELFSNTGASDFPFEKISNGTFNIGIVAPYSAIVVGRAVFWLGQDEYGYAQVYEATGINPRIISTTPIALLLQQATNLSDVVAWAYQEKGRTFYILTGGGLETSLCYDLEAKSWHERAYCNSDGNFEQHRGITCVFAFNKQLVGDRDNGKIYNMDMDIYSDNGDAIVRERIYRHIFEEGYRIKFPILEIGAETGVGLQNGQGTNPIIALSVSKDGGKTYGDVYTQTLGAAGSFYGTIRFRRLGISESMTFKIRISDPVKVALFGSYLKDLEGEQ